jgi:hypothetical protein
MAGMIHHSTGRLWPPLPTILDHGSLMARNRGSPYRELPQARVAVREGTFGELARYIADRGFSWREQAWALTVAQPTTLDDPAHWASSIEFLLKGLVWECAGAQQRTRDKPSWWSASRGLP